MAVANLEKNSPNEFSQTELVHIVTKEELLPLLIRLVRRSDGAGLANCAGGGSKDQAADNQAKPAVSPVSSSTDQRMHGELQPLQAFCARVLAHAAARESLRERLVDEGAATALIWMAGQYVHAQATQDAQCSSMGLAQTGTAVVTGQQVYVPPQPSSSIQGARPCSPSVQQLAPKSASSSVAELPNSTYLTSGSSCNVVHESVATLLPQSSGMERQLLCIITALADLAATPRFASVLLARNNDAGMDALLATLSAVLTSRHSAELVQHASRALANLVCGSAAEGCIADMTGSAVFASGMFCQLEQLTVLPQDPVVVQNVARVLAKVGNVFTPMSHDSATAYLQSSQAGTHVVGGGDGDDGVSAAHEFDRHSSFDGGESEANESSVVGCGSAVGGSFSSLNNSFGHSWSSLSGMLPWSSSGPPRGDNNDAHSVQGRRLSSVCGSQPVDAMLPRIVRECIRHKTGTKWFNRLAVSDDRLVRRAAASLYGLVAMHAHAWLVHQASSDNDDGLDELAVCILNLAIAPDDQPARLDAKKALAKLVSHYDRFKAALLMHTNQAKLKPLLQVLCKTGSSITTGNEWATPVDDEKQLASFILRKLIESSGCRQVMLNGPLADVVSDVLRIYDDIRISLHMSFVFKDVSCDEATKQKLDSEFISALLHMMSPVGAWHVTH